MKDQVKSKAKRACVKHLLTDQDTESLVLLNMKIDGIYLISLVLLGLVCGEEDLYSILNVPRSASQPEIKRAYKKLAVKW